MRIEKRDHDGRYTHFHFYDGAIDLDGAIDSMPVRDDEAKKQRNDLACGKLWHEPDWYGGLQSVEEGRNLVRKGWPEGATRVKALADRVKSIIPEPTSIKRKMMWAEEGDDVSMERVYSGDLDHAWQTRRRRTVNVPPVITINIPWGGNYDRTAEELFWTSAPALALADALESAGYRVELQAVTQLSHYEVRQVLCVRLKDADMPLDLGAIAAVCCHGGVFRTLGFAAICKHEGRLSSSLGHCVDASKVFEGINLKATLNESEAIAETERVIRSLDSLASHDEDSSRRETNTYDAYRMTRQ